MSKSKKNEELQSRREFFKQAAKAALPVVGAAIMASVPFAQANAMGCNYACTGNCYGGCDGVCGGNCINTCSNSCSNYCTGCRNTCSNGCYNTCTGGNYY